MKKFVCLYAENLAGNNLTGNAIKSAKLTGNTRNTGKPLFPSIRQVDRDSWYHLTSKEKKKLHAQKVAKTVSKKTVEFETKVEQLMGMYHAAPHYITTKEQFEALLNRVFSSISSLRHTDTLRNPLDDPGLSINKESEKDLKASQLTDQLLGTVALGRPGVKEIMKHLPTATKVQEELVRKRKLKEAADTEAAEKAQEAAYFPERQKI